MNHVEGAKIIAQYANEVRVWSYPAMSGGRPVTSFEVYRGRGSVGRFLHLDLGEEAEATARAFAAGYATALTHAGSAWKTCTHDGEARPGFCSKCGIELVK